MKVYFVRHGETVGNAQQFHQDAHTPLTEIGIDQAHFVAHRFTKIQIDGILSSDFQRAQQTAQIIADKLDKPFETTPLLREIKRPTEIEGKHIYDPSITKLKDLIRSKQDDPNYHYSDEENFFDLFKRVQKFIRLLNKRKEKSLLAVTHGVTLRSILSTVLFQDNLTPHIFAQIDKRLKTTNTGLSLIEKEPNSDWIVRIFNDHSHLG